jgi:hypothetical protein
MTDKLIKNDQWCVKELVNKINNNKISKPQFNRKRKWDDTHKKDNKPNDQDYIDFLFRTHNSVHAITFGQYVADNGSSMLSNIDGNNRINAICHFIQKPFEIFAHYLDELNSFIDAPSYENRINNLNKEERENLKKIYRNLTYTEIVNFNYKKYFIENGHTDFYHNKLQPHRDAFETVIEDLQSKLKINGTDHFDLNVKINVNLFEGYNTDELCKVFEDINKYTSQLTETELLACRLCYIFGFTILDEVFKTELQTHIKQYYVDKAENEILSCYQYDTTLNNINAHDFIVGFQNLCNSKYNFIEKSDVDGLSLFFKIYKANYLSFVNTFTTENVTDFINKINNACEIFNEVIVKIFADKINEKLFNKSCTKKLSTLKKNNLFILICCIIGFTNQEVEPLIIKREIERCLLYHFMVAEIKDKDKRADYKIYDSIIYEAGGAYIDGVTKLMLSEPYEISNKITEERFSKVIEQLYKESNNPYIRTLETGKKKVDKRRFLKFYEKTLMFYYYKEHMPTNLLNEDFSLEHICPNSSEWEGELDKDRTGNLMPIIDGMNKGRGNRHINYYDNEKYTEFCRFIKDIKPTNDEYDEIISHIQTGRKPVIKSNEKYNNLCKKNENIYKQNFLNCLFRI